MVVDHGAMDGRKARAERSRAAIVDAFLRLLPDADRRPTVEEIAVAAGVSERSVYRHFPDVDALVEAAVSRRIELMAPLSVFEVDPGAALEDRVTALSAQRADFYEAALPLRRFTERVRGDVPRLAELERGRRVFLRDQLWAAFAPELEQFDAERRRCVRHALEVAASWATWYHLRAEQRRTVEEAREVLETTVRALLRPA